MHTGKSTKRGTKLRNKAIWPCLSQDLNPISNPSEVGFKMNPFIIGSIFKKLLKHIATDEILHGRMVKIFSKPMLETGGQLCKSPVTSYFYYK